MSLRSEPEAVQSTTPAGSTPTEGEKAGDMEKIDRDVEQVVAPASPRSIHGFAVRLPTTDSSNILFRCGFFSDQLHSGG